MLKVIKVQILTGRGTDKISLTLDTETTFPLMPEYGCHATIEAQKGTGADWVRRELGIEPEVIETGC